jgi:hypothetical protein
MVLPPSVFIRVHPWLNFFRLELELLLIRRAAMSPSLNQNQPCQKIMEIVDTLKLEIKKLSSQAIQTKMDLHDLSEELPTNWERIPEMAQKTFQVYEKLIAAKQRLAALGG